MIALAYYSNIVYPFFYFLALGPIFFANFCKFLKFLFLYVFDLIKDMF